MGQKVNPIGFRLGIIRGWDSNWFGGKNYADKIVEDNKIRKYIAARINNGGISKVVIERTLKRIIITVHTSRPGIIIGKGGQEVDRIKEEIKKLTKKDVQINIFEIKRPELDAYLVSESISRQLEARVSFRRAMKMALGFTMRNGAEGIKIICSGRLGGAEIARTEQYKDGRVPLHTLRADIDYALTEAQTVYGKIGVKVWICRGEIYGRPDLSPNLGVRSVAREGTMRPESRDRRDDNRGGRDRRDGGRGQGGPGGPGQGGGGGRGPGQGGGGRGPGGPGGNRGPGGGNRGGGAPRGR